MGRTLSPHETPLDPAISRLPGSLGLFSCSSVSPDPEAPSPAPPRTEPPPPPLPASGPEEPDVPAEHVRKTDLVAALLYGVGVFAGVHALALLCLTSLRLYHTFGVRNSLQEFDLIRFLAVSTLPLGFNLIFGLFFGQKYWGYGRSIPEKGSLEGNRFEDPWPLHWICNPWLWVFLGWLTLFNLPRFFDGAPVLVALRHFVLPPWPPAHYYIPIRTEVVLYMAVGNRALFAGFLATVGWLWFSARIARQDPLPPSQPE
ncbi:MAG TPA: hypothetical protein PKH31_16165 [Candidatus Sumerlaeota bacterium]|nr:hypothetical protein [Candidatus Sumerlaeota bacterium]